MNAFWVALLLLVNLNTATLQELAKLPGVNRTLAARIVEFRERNGGFRRVEELLAVRGVSETKWRRIRPLVTVD